jgi:hypothetical protein
MSSRPPVQGSLFEDQYLIRTLGAIARDPDAALTELVANAWDAGASEVQIQLPMEIRQKLTVADDGIGMTQEEFHHRWMTLGYNRVRHQGAKVQFPPERSDWQRSAFGRNGVGRHGMLCFADSYTVHTSRDGITWQFRVDTTSGTDPFVLTSEKSRSSSSGKHGTRLECTVQRNRADPDAIRDILSARFIHDPQFFVFVNGASIPLTEHPGLLHQDEVEVNPNVRLTLSVMDTTKAARTKRQQGISYWVGGRLVGDPTWSIKRLFSVDGRTNFGKRYSIIVQSNDIFEEVLPDWSGFRRSEVMNAVYEQVAKYVEQQYLEISRARIDETKTTVLRQHISAIRDLNGTAKLEVSEFVEQVVAAHPTIQADTLSAAVEAVINLEQSKSGRSLIAKLGKLSEGDVEGLDRLLSEWSVRDALIVLDEVDRRVAIIEAINRLSKDKTTDELHTLHPLVTEARWLFGPEFDTPEYASNVSIRNAVEKVFKEKVDKANFVDPKKRPDLLILKDASFSAVALESFGRDSDTVVTREVLLIEIKRGKSSIGREEMFQAEGYVQDILNSGLVDGRPFVRSFVVGHEVRDKTEHFKTLGDPEYGRIQATTFGQLIRTAEKRLFKLRDLLKNRYALDGEAMSPLLNQILKEPQQVDLIPECEIK